MVVFSLAFTAAFTEDADYITFDGTHTKKRLPTQKKTQLGLCLLPSTLYNEGKQQVPGSQFSVPSRGNIQLGAKSARAGNF